jgi:hypothetical protein
MGLGCRFRMDLRHQGDQVGQLPNGLQIPERRESLQAARIEVVARQERQVLVGAVQQARPRVVEEVSLPDGLEEDRVLRGGIRGARTGRDQHPQRRDVTVGIADMG